MVKARPFKPEILKSFRLSSLTRLLQQLDGLCIEAHGFSVLTGFETLVTGLFQIRPRL